MLFLNQDIELSLDLRRQHQYVESCSVDDPYFSFNEGSSLMQAVSAYGNIQHQQMIPISENICKVAFNMQPGPIPGFDVNRLDLAHHLCSYTSGQFQTEVNTSTSDLQQHPPGGKKRSYAGSQAGSQKSSEGSPMPASKRSKPTSVVHTSYRM